MFFRKPRVRDSAVETVLTALDVYTDAKMVILMKKLNGGASGNEHEALKAAKQAIRKGLQFLI